MCFWRSFRHLEQYHLTYGAHFCHACHLIMRLGKVATQLMVHAIWPDWYEHDATKELRCMLQEHDDLMS